MEIYKYIVTFYTSVNTDSFIDLFNGHR